MTSRSIVLVASLVLAVLMVTAALLFSGPSQSATLVTAEGTDELLKEYASKDSDSDGLLDWEESLYNTDPTDPHSFRKDLLDGEAVKQKLIEPVIPTTETPSPEELLASLSGIDAAPGTVTREFARKFLQDFVTKDKDGIRSEEEVEIFVASLLDELKTTSATQNAFSASNAKIGPSSGDTLRAYAIAAEQILNQSNNVVSGDAGDLFASVVKKNDTKAAQSLKKHAAGYTEAARVLMQTSVPSVLLSAHVALANSFQRLGESIGNMGSFLEDPLRGFLGLTQYENARVQLVEAFAAFSPAFKSSGVVLEGTEKGFVFYYLSERSAEGVAARKEREANQ